MSKSQSQPFQRVNVMPLDAKTMDQLFTDLFHGPDPDSDCLHLSRSSLERRE